MRIAFGDFFYWALLGETDRKEVASTCMDACQNVQAFCCASVLMKGPSTNFYEKHCINMFVARANYQTTVAGFDMSIQCDNIKNGAMMKFVSLSVATIAALTLF